MSVDEQPTVGFDIYDLIEVNGRISKKLFQKVVIPKLNELESLRTQLREARILAEMVQDNTKMPHQHTDPQLRLYCLAERAAEFLAKYPEDEE